MSSIIPAVQQISPGPAGVFMVIRGIKWNGHFESMIFPWVSVKHATVSVPEHPQEKIVYGVRQHHLGYLHRAEAMETSLLPQGPTFHGSVKKEEDQGRMGAPGFYGRR